MRRGIHFDPTITLGSVLSLLTLLAALAGGAVRLEHRLTVLEVKVDLLMHHPLDPRRP